MGNVRAVTFVGSSGTKTVYRESCRTTLGLRSMRFRVGDQMPAPTGQSCYVDGSESVLEGLSGVYTISGGGIVSQYSGGASGAYAITSGGIVALGEESQAPVPQTQQSGSFTFSGSGWGHNVGMSQWGAAAMAELGFDFREILEFYYTGVEIR